MMIRDDDIRPNNTERALVLYVPPKAKKSINEFSQHFYNAYRDKYKYYYLYFAFVAVISVIAFKLYSVYPEFADAYSDKLFSEYRTYAYSVKFLLRNFLGNALTVSIAFLAGFTVFGLPVSVLCLSHILLSSFFLFGKLTKIADFYVCFAVVLVFSLFAFISVLFFTETSIAYVKLSDGKNTELLKYILGFISYLLLAALLIYFGFEILAAY